MALDTTHSEESLKYSLKKYFIEGLKLVGVKSYFTYRYMDMKDASDNNLDSWIIFHYGGSRIEGILNDTVLNAYVFSRGSAGEFAEDLLSITRDKLFGMLLDNNYPDMVPRIPLYDIATKTVKGYMLVKLRRESEDDRGYDKTVYRHVVIDIKFAVK